VGDGYELCAVKNLEILSWWYLITSFNTQKKFESLPRCSVFIKKKKEFGIRCLQSEVSSSSTATSACSFDDRFLLPVLGFLSCSIQVGMGCLEVSPASSLVITPDFCQTDL